MSVANYTYTFFIVKLTLNSLYECNLVMMHYPFTILLNSFSSYFI